MGEIINFKKEFFDGVNNEDDPRALGIGEALNIENLRVGISATSKNFQLTNIPSTDLLWYYVPINSKPIGRVFDYSRRRLIWCHYDPAGEDAIFAYDLNANTTYFVLRASQTAEGLNYSMSFRIARNMRVVNGLLLYTDNNNEPQEINIEAGIKLNQPSYTTNVEPYAQPIPYTTLTLIKRPPIHELTVAKITDAGFEGNFTANYAFQFFYRYQYKNYEYSALSAISELIPFNFKEDTYNAVHITIPVLEHIDDYILVIDLCVRFGNHGKSFVIKTWDKRNAYDAMSIATHNSGAVDLYYYFYNNKLNYALSDLEANTYFDNVARKAKTLEVGKNRVFLANVLKGYNTPTETSLTLALGTPSSVDTIIFKSGSTYRESITFFDRFKRPTGRIDADVSVLVPERVYSQTSFVSFFSWTLSNTNALVEIPDTAFYYQIDLSVNQNKAFYLQGIYKDAAYAVKDVYGVLDFTGTTYDSLKTYALAIDLAPFTAVGEGYVYSSENNDEAIIHLSTDVNFYTRVIGQSGRYVLLAPIDIGTIINAYNYTLVGAEIGAIDYVPMTLEVEYSQVGYSFRSVDAGHLSGDVQDSDNWMGLITDGNAYNFQITGTISYKAVNTASSPFAITAYVVDAGGDEFTYDLAAPTLATAGATYEFDVNTTIVVPATYIKIVVLGRSADSDFRATITGGNLTIGEASAYNLIELFTPYVPSDSDPFYGVSPIYEIENPTTNLRAYHTLVGIITGDSYIISRIETSVSFLVESMSPNDNTWQQWERNLGWPSFLDNIGEQQKEDSIDWSDTYINGTQNNGINKFQALNTKNIGGDSGAIMKLQLANKLADETGSILIIIAQDEILSAYLQEVQTYNAATQGAIITTDAVIGSINAMKFTAGTVNPESIVEYNGVIFGIDVIRGFVWQYDANGVSPVSWYKMRQFFDHFSRRYLELGTAGVEALCGFSYIETSIDPTTGEFLITLPQTEENSYISLLPSYLLGTGIWKYMVLYYTTGGSPIEVDLYYIHFTDGSSYYPEIYQDPDNLPLFVNFTDITAVGFSEASLADFILATYPPPAGTWVNPQTPTFFATAEVVNLFQAEGATTIQNKFNIYDGQPKTMTYNFEKNKWYGAYQWLPDLMEYGGNKVFGFKDGWLYQFNENISSFNTIFGVQYPQRICFTVNLEASIPKDIFDIAIEGNQKIPNFTVCYTEQPNIQITDLTQDDYKNKEGIIYARFFRDRMSPNVTGTVIDKLYKGDVLKSVTAFIMIEFQVYDGQLINNFVDIGFDFSAGHLQIVSKK